MKLRIKGNSVRIRLTKTEVTNFGETGFISDETSFYPDEFKYALKSDPMAKEMTAVFEKNCITVLMPAGIAEEWTQTDRVGFENSMMNKKGESVFILVEKDFKCLEETAEDQSDNFENPNSACGSD